MLSGTSEVWWVTIQCHVLLTVHQWVEDSSQSTAAKLSDQPRRERKNENDRIYVHTGYYMMARRYEFYVRMARTISHEWAQRTALTIFLSYNEHKRYCKFLQLSGRNFFNFRISSSLVRSSLNNFKLHEVLFFVLAFSCFSLSQFFTNCLHKQPCNGR